MNPLPAICGYVCPHPREDECNVGAMTQKHFTSAQIEAMVRVSAMVMMIESESKG